jgi:hypothetical protein
MLSGWVFPNRGGHRLHDADRPGVAQDNLTRSCPADPLLAALLHVPLTRGMQAEVELLAIPLSLQEELRLLQPGAETPVRRPLAIGRDRETDDGTAVLHESRQYGQSSTVDHRVSGIGCPPSPTRSAPSALLPRPQASTRA